MTEQQPQNERFEFSCKRCGAEESVGFTPRDPNDLLCRDCFEETGGRTYDLSNLTKAPRRKHGTRVAFRISCAECGKDDELDYVPKGVPVDEILCKDCMLERSGASSRWALVEGEKDREQRRKKKHPVTCASCSNVEELPFKPQPDREYLCYVCYLDQERAADLGLPTEPREPKHDLGDNMFIRKRKPKPVTEGSDATE